MDHHKCPAASKIHKTTKGKTVCNDDCDCDAGNYCNIGQAYGHCCEKEFKGRWRSFPNGEIHINFLKKIIFKKSV